MTEKQSWQQIATEWQQTVAHHRPPAPKPLEAQILQAVQEGQPLICKKPYKGNGVRYQVGDEVKGLDEAKAVQLVRYGFVDIRERLDAGRVATAARKYDLNEVQPKRQLVLRAQSALSQAQAERAAALVKVKEAEGAIKDAQARLDQHAAELTEVIQGADIEQS